MEAATLMDHQLFHYLVCTQLKRGDTEVGDQEGGVGRTGERVALVQGSHIHEDCGAGGLKLISYHGHCVLLQGHLVGRMCEFERPE